MKVSRNDNQRDAITKHGWILMTRMMGDPVSVDTFNKADIPILASQLASIVSNWRTNVPAADNYGNISIVHEGQNHKGSFKTTPSFISGMSFAIGTCILASDLKCSSPASDIYTYIRLKFEHRLDKLNSLDSMKINRHFATTIRDFIDTDLPKLQILKITPNGKEWSSVFTHNDQTPQNLLVTGNPPQITGIIDFSLARFFPDLDEFLSDTNSHSVS